MSTNPEMPKTEITEKAAKSKKGVLIGTGVGAVVLLGGGAFAAMQFLGGDGEQPAAVLPGDAAAYLRLDVDPEAGQKLAAVRFFEGLDPEIKERFDSGQWREWVWEQIEAEGDVPEGFTYAEDVEPWLGDRAGVAILPNGSEEPIVAVALQVKDGQKALDALQELDTDGGDESGGYYLAGDYVVLTDEQHQDSVKSMADSGSLADNEDFKADMDSLGGQGIASAWLDLERVAEFSESDLNKEMDDLAEMGGDPFSDLAETKELLAGTRIAATLRLTPDSIEVHGQQTINDEMPVPDEAQEASTMLINALPTDTAGAFAFEHGAAWTTSMWDFYAEKYPEQASELQTEAGDAGFALPADLATALGNSMTLSVGGDIVEASRNMSQTDPNMPQLPIGYRVETDETALNDLLSKLGMPAGTIPQRADEGVVTLGLDQAYVDNLAAAKETLGEDATYQAAVADYSDAAGVFYLNVNSFEEYYLPEVTDENARGALEQLAAVGLSGTYGDERSTFTLRFVADAAE